jgi:hypothetical protein
MITHELMRELLNCDLQSIREIAEFVPNEIVYNALIIREFMMEHQIDDSRQGIREFYAFKRVRLGSLVSNYADQIAKQAIVQDSR